MRSAAVRHSTTGDRISAATAADRRRTPRAEVGKGRVSGASSTPRRRDQGRHRTQLAFFRTRQSRIRKVNELLTFGQAPCIAGEDASPGPEPIAPGRPGARWTAFLFFSITTVAAQCCCAVCVVWRRRPPQPAASEADLATITDNIPAMVAFVDRDLRYRFVNRNYERWLGVKPEDMLGRTAMEVYGDERYAAAAAEPGSARVGPDLRGGPPHSPATPRARALVHIMYMPRWRAKAQVSGVYILSNDIPTSSMPKAGDVPADTTS